VITLLFRVIVLVVYTAKQERLGLSTYIGSLQWSQFLVIPCSKHNFFDGGTVRQFVLSCLIVLSVNVNIWVGENLTTM